MMETRTEAQAEQSTTTNEDDVKNIIDEHGEEFLIINDSATHTLMQEDDSSSSTTTTTPLRSRANSPINTSHNNPRTDDDATFHQIVDNHVVDNPVLVSPFVVDDTSLLAVDDASPIIADAVPIVTLTPTAATSTTSTVELEIAFRKFEHDDKTERKNKSLDIGTNVEEEEEDDDDERSVITPPGDAFSVCHTMMPVEYSSNTTRTSAATTSTAAAVSPPQEQEQYMIAKKLLQEEFPKFVTPLAASFIEICLLTLYAHVADADKEEEEEGLVHIELLNLLWGEILQQVSNIAMAGKTSNLTISIILDILNTYISCVHISFNNNNNMVHVKFSNVHQLVLPLLRSQLLFHHHHHHQEEEVTNNKSVCFLWTQIMKSLLLPNENTTFSNSARYYYYDTNTTNNDDTNKQQQLQPIHYVHCLLTLACRKQLAHVFLLNSESNHTYATLHIHVHWIKSKMYASSIYLLYLNSKYIIHRITAELSRNNNTINTTNADVRQAMWSNPNMCHVVENLTIEMMDTCRTTPTNEEGSYCYYYEKIIDAWFHTLVPQQEDFFLSCHDDNRRSLICYRIGCFLSSLSTLIDHPSLLKKNNHHLSIQYLLYSVHWKNRAMCYLRFDNNNNSITTTTTTVARVAVSKMSSTTTTTTSVATSSAISSSSTPEEYQAGGIIPTTKLDPLLIVAILLGFSEKKCFLDIVDSHGIHIFLPFDVALPFCQSLADTLYQLALKYDGNDIDNAMSCLNGALEILLLRSSSSSSERKVAPNHEEERVDLSLSDGLKFGGDDDDDEASVSSRTRRLDRTHSTNDILTSSSDQKRNNSSSSSNNRISSCPALWADSERWIILSKIELHRGMLIYPIDLGKALDCFHRAKDYSHRSSSSFSHFHHKHLEQLSTVYSWIASSYRELGQSQLAIDFFQESIDYSNKACSANNNDSRNNHNMVYSLHTANGLFNMAVTFDDLGMFDQSISKYHEAYSMLVTVWDKYYALSELENNRAIVTAPTIASILTAQSDHSASKSNTSSASVLSEMLEVWICLGNVNLLMQEEQEEANNINDNSEQHYKWKALECFIKGLTIFLEKWCKISAPSTRDGSDDDNNNINYHDHVVADAYGQQLHCVTDFIAKYSAELMATTIGATETEQEDQLTHNFLMCRGSSPKSSSNTVLAAEVSGTIHGHVAKLNDLRALEDIVCRLLERTKEVLQIVTPPTPPTNEVECKETSKIDFLATCWIVLSEVDLYFHNVGSSMECIGRSYECRKPLDSSLYFYRRGVCYLRMRDYNSAIESFVHFLKCMDGAVVVFSATDTRRKRDVFYHLGYAHAQIGHYARSVEFYTQSLQYNTKDSTAAASTTSEDGMNGFAAQIYQEMSIVYLLECSMKHDEFVAFTESARSIGEHEGIRSLLSTEVALKYMTDAIAFHHSSSTRSCSNIESIIAYAFACKQMGILCRVLRLWDDSEYHFQTSLHVLRQLPRTDESALEIASVSYEMGLLYSLRPKQSLTEDHSVEGNSYLDSAEIYLREALHVYELQVGWSDDQRYIGHKVSLAKTWYHLGRVSILKEPFDKEAGTLGSVALEFMNEALSLMREIHPCAVASIHQRSIDDADVSSTSSSTLWDLYTSEFMSQLYHDIGVAYFSFCLYSMALECFNHSEDLRLRIINSMKVDAMKDSCTVDIDNVDSSHSNLLPTTPFKDFRFWSSVGNIHYMKLAKTLNNMGVVYSKLDQYEKSSLCLDQALEIRTKRRELFWALNKMSTAEYSSHIFVEQEYCTALINAGHLHAKMHLHAKALECFEKAGDILESIVDTKGTYCLLANLYHSIARSHASLGHWADAKTFFVKSLYLRRHKINFETKPETMMVEVDDSLSDNYYRESTSPLPVHDSNEESDSALRLSHTLHQLGIVHENLSDYREAIICYEEAWFIRKLHLTRDHVIMAQSLCRIGNLKLLVHDDCNNDVALKCFQEALRVQRKHLGDYALEVSETYYRMGMIHHVRTEFQDARRCYTSALQIYQYHGVINHDDDAAYSSAVAAMQEVRDAWNNLELAESENSDGVTDYDWSKLALNPKGCVAKMEEILLHLLRLVDQYLVQPGADNLQKAGSFVMDSVYDVYTPENPSRSLPPPTSAMVSPSPRFVYDVQQQLCMIQE